MSAAATPSWEKKRVDLRVEAVEAGGTFSGYASLFGKVDLARDMDDVGVLEAATDLDDGIDFADVAEELIAEPLPFAGPFDDAGDVDELDRRGDDFLRNDVFRDPLQAAVGHADDAFVGLDGTKRIVRALGRFRTGESVKERAFAHVGQPDDTGFHDERTLSDERRRNADC